MIIQVERSGGFTGIPLQAKIDTHRLDASAGQAIETLVSAAAFFELPARIASPAKGADRFQYHIHIQSETRRHEVDVSDGAGPAALNELIRQVIALAR